MPTKKKKRAPAPPPPAAPPVAVPDDLDGMSDEEIARLSEEIDREQAEIDAENAAGEGDSQYFEPDDPMTAQLPNYIDNDLGFHLEINDMHARRFMVEKSDGGEDQPFKDFTRDYSNANLEKVEVEHLRVLNKLYQLCVDLKAMDAASWVLRNIYAILATSRGKNGFERRMTVSQFTHGSMKSEQKTFEDKPSSFLMWARKKKSSTGGL